MYFRKQLTVESFFNKALILLEFINLYITL